MIAHLTVVLEREVEREAADTLRLGARGNLQALDDARVALVLKTRILTLRVLTDDGEVDVVVTGGEARKGLAKNNGRACLGEAVLLDCPVCNRCFVYVFAAWYCI